MQLFAQCRELMLKTVDATRLLGDDKTVYVSITCRQHDIRLRVRSTRLNMSKPRNPTLFGRDCVVHVPNGIRLVESYGVFPAGDATFNPLVSDERRVQSRVAENQGWRFAGRVPTYAVTLEPIPVDNSIPHNLLHRRQGFQIPYLTTAEPHIVRHNVPFI